MYMSVQSLAREASSLAYPGIQGLNTFFIIFLFLWMNLLTSIKE